MGDKIDPSEVNKNPQLIRDAQNEIGKLDVLVCGECHLVFHYIEQFQEHKLLGKCPRESAILDSCVSEQKPQVWAFMLWKNAKFRNAPLAEGSPSSWSVYQLWCNLENSQKEAWVTAGRSIQSFTKLSSAKVQEVKSKVQIHKSPHGNTKAVRGPGIGKEEEEAEDDPLEEGEIRISQLSEAQRKALKVNREASGKDDVDPLADTDSEMDTEDEVEREAAMRQDKKEKGLIRKPLGATYIKKNGTAKKATRTAEDKKEEYTIEKIISKKYNHGRKRFEYYIKWENCDDSENTWEPAVHLTGCKQLLEEFEENFKKQRAIKLAQKQAAKKLEKQAEMKSRLLSIASAPGGRPQRTSKQKALNQVKAWCGSISDGDEPSGKRPLSDSDSDSIEKKLKLELNSSDSEVESTPIKKLKASLNGVGKKQPLPENVLVPDSQGIVRINQKQLPALSSGVYVMSKTAGIIKLDSNTSKIATSGGHAVIKVAPKIGQTSIKVIKKDAVNGNKTIFCSNKVKVGSKVYSPKIVKKTLPSPVKQPDPAAESPKHVEESDDGVEELEFPTDLPLPEPDSPPGDFTLCPLTGKIVGQDYPEEAEVKTKVEAGNSDNMSLDNIVKLAAADILQEKDSADTEDVKVPTQVSEALTQPKPVKSEQSAVEASTSSILSTALSNANIDSLPELTPISKKEVPIIHHKVDTPRNTINRTVNSKPTPQAIITRITPGSAHRHKTMKPTPTGSSFQSNIIRKPAAQPYTNRKVVRKSVYQPADVPALHPKVVSKVAAAKPVGSVINMPLLTEPETPQAEDVPEPAVAAEAMELNTISINENEAPMLITGEDGTIYQVAGENEEGQTILITHDADGQQQCLLVASENAAELNQAVSTAPIVDAPVEQPLVINTEQEGETEMETESTEDSQVVAQIVSAQPPSPGGTRKVVLMLPDGNLMMTEVTAEQYAALELDK